MLATACRNLIMTCLLHSTGMRKDTGTSLPSVALLPCERGRHGHHWTVQVHTSQPLSSQTQAVFVQVEWLHDRSVGPWPPTLSPVVLQAVVKDCEVQRAACHPCWR